MTYQGVTKEIFEREVRKVKNGDHWHWLGPRSAKSGEPFLRIGPNFVRAYRAAWWLYRGNEDCTEKSLRCTCNDNQCINPFHREALGLRESTQGSRHGRAVLTEEDVLDIRERADRGEKQKIIAQAYGVSQARISQILNGKAWTHVK